MTQKEIAIECLTRLDVYKPYIKKFNDTGIPCFFENFAGFYSNQEPKLWNKIKEVENEFGCLVYAVTHELTDFGECWSMLCVGSDCEPADSYIFKDTSGVFYTFAYVWNSSNEIFSEFGDIGVRTGFGGLKRIH